MFEMLAACVKSYVFYVKPKFVNLYAQSSEIGLHLVCVSRCCEYIGDDVMFAVYGSAVKIEEAFRFTFPVHKSAAGSVVRAFTVLTSSLPPLALPP